MNNESALALKKHSGTKLKNIRVEKGLTQAQLAHKLTELKQKHDKNSIVTRQTISKYENGERGMSLEMIADISSVLDIPVNYFFPNQTTLENTIEKQTTELFSKTIIDEDGYSLEIKTTIPFDNLTIEEQKEIMDSAMEELLEFKKKIRKTTI